jgi:beta-N-acetylhexosaminidase
VSARRTTAVLAAAAVAASVALVPSNAEGTAQPRTARAVFAEMTPAQRVGQLFMVGTPAISVDRQTLAQIGRYHVGNLILTGRSYDGTGGPARIAARFQARATTAATDDVRLLVACDQEGGEVQVLHGDGLSEMPTALRQGRWSVARLQRSAGRWARQLEEAGVNMNLAPVMDTVPSAAAARTNRPIGYYHREFGYTTTRVAAHGTAFARGMDEAGVAPTLKHFPGLGRVVRNTDDSHGVTDRVTTRHDAYLTPFKTAIDSGHVPFVMVSLAYYAKLDPHHMAVFSPFVIRTMLRGDLGFTGVVVSDSLTATQVNRIRPGRRAVRFLRAGGDLVLIGGPDQLSAMYHAVLRRARADATFRAKVDRAALLVLEAKQRQHLLGPG